MNSVNNMSNMSDMKINMDTIYDSDYDDDEYDRAIKYINSTGCIGRSIMNVATYITNNYILCDECVKRCDRFDEIKKRVDARKKARADEKKAN